MKKLILILLILISNQVMSQVDETDSNFRQFKGRVVGALGEPIVAQTVMVKGTKVGAQTDFEGNFCLVLPKELTVYIEIPLLDYDTLREIKPADKSIVLKLRKKKGNPSRASNNWNRKSEDLTQKLQEQYGSKDYKIAEKKICR